MHLPSRVHKPFLISWNLKLLLQTIHLLRNLPRPSSVNNWGYWIWDMGRNSEVGSRALIPKVQKITPPKSACGWDLWAAQRPLTWWSINQAFLQKSPTECCSPISQAACIQQWRSPLSSFKRRQTLELMSPMWSEGSPENRMLPNSHVLPIKLPTAQFSDTPEHDTSLILWSVTFE